MKHHSILVAVILISGILSFLLWPFSLAVSASNSQNELIEQIEESLDISVFYQKESDRLIKCFDVNKDGCYAIGNKYNTIHIYDSQGSFQYGYRFETDGTYGIVLKENSIVIYLGRSNIAVEVDPTGKCINAEKVYFSKDIVDNVMNRNYKQIGDVNYYLERDIGIFNGDYSRLVKTDEREIKAVLYDVTTRGYFVGAFHYLVLSMFPIAGVIVITVKLKKEKYDTDA